MNISILSRNSEKLDEMDLKCEIHSKGEMNMVCLEESCDQKGLTCRYCISEFHRKHSNNCMPVDCFLKRVYSIRRELKKNLLEKYFIDSVSKLNEVLTGLFNISEELNKLVVKKREGLEAEGKQFKNCFHEKFKRFDNLYQTCLSNRTSVQEFKPSLLNIIELVQLESNFDLSVNIFDDLEDKIRSYSTKIDLVYMNSQKISQDMRASLESIALIDDLVEKKLKRRNSSSHQTLDNDSEEDNKGLLANLRKESVILDNFPSIRGQRFSREESSKHIINQMKDSNIFDKRNIRNEELGIQNFE